MNGNHDGPKFEELTEGKVKITFEGSKETFYNPVQEFNRDLTVCVLRQFVDDRTASASASNGTDQEPVTKRRKKNLSFASGEPIRVLDALSASGLRALRFAKEVPGVGEVLANDFSDAAVDAIERNIKVNGVEDRVRASFGDAVVTMMAHRSFEKRFHAIDLDPYGSAAMFLDSAVQAVADGGLLMVTCTDMGTLCGNTPEACYNKYNSVPLRHKSCHEMAIRILLRSIDSHANRYGRYIEPLLSVSIDFYIRCFVRLRTGPSAAKDSVTKLSQFYACSGCHSLAFQPLVRKTNEGTSVKFSAAPFQAHSLIGSNGKCVHCGSAVHVGGPLYIAPMHDPGFVGRILQRLQTTPEEDLLGTHARLTGVLTVVSEELHDVPLYYEHDQLMHVVKCPMPKSLLSRSAILNAGFRCSLSHCNPKALKTDAPPQFLWDLSRAIAKKNDISSEKLQEGSAGQAILSAEPKHEISFTLHPEATAKSQANHLLRFQDNKGKNWGPKPKAKGSVNSVQAGFQDSASATDG
ncbi:Protein TRM-1 [Aphelenchoides avenae]|nr:Protein TRM-1 [Aphelenchus avenae]